LRFPGFIGPSYTLQSVNVDCQRCVNLYPEINALGTGKEREVAALVPTPGLLLKLTLPTSPVRGVYRASSETLFAVGGDKFYSVSNAWVATELGSLQTSEGPVSMSDNGQHVFIVDGDHGYTWTLNDTIFSTVTDEDFTGADQVSFIDGYFTFTKSGASTFFFSGLNDVAIDGLDFATVEGSPDTLVGHIVSKQNIYLFGTQSTEVFYDSGDADNPFQRIQGAMIEVGCAAAFSIAKLQNAVYFLGGDENGSGIVYRMDGYQPQRISTPAIESVIRDIDPDTLADSRAWTYQQGGHAFYCLNLPGANSTWVFDASTEMWHERAYKNLWALQRHRADCHAVAYGLNVVGDYESGNIYALDQSTYTDNGDAMIRIRTAPHMSSGLVRVFHSHFQLDMETGVGLDGSGQGTDPQAMLEWSDDGGHTWSEIRVADIGKIGKTRTRTIWRRLGSSRDRVYRVSIADPVKVVLIGADVGAEAGAS
jgi:hypothetical protein